MNSSLENTRNIYVISGLGADHRVFERLDLPGFQLIHLPWISPKKRESFSEYTVRFMAEIRDENPLILGLSFGGFVAQEIARQRRVSKIILLSSARSRKELPYIYRLTMRYFFSYLPHRAFRINSKMMQWYFGLKTGEEKKLLGQILKSADPAFMKWAMYQVGIWNPGESGCEIYQIHGKADRLIHPGRILADHWIDGGSHFMVWQKPEEVSVAIANALKKSE